MGVELPVEPLKVKFVPDEAMVNSCGQLGAQIARLIKESSRQ
jgi:hypothetical protein